jgi:hypothetical protein
MVYFRFGDYTWPSSFHKKILCDKIPAFKDELKRLGPDGTVLDFPEYMSEAIEALVEFCYKDKLPKVTKTTSPEECYTRIRLYCLAEEYGHIGLMNDSIDFIIGYLRKHRPRWDVEWCGYIYQNTARGSQLRVLVAKWFYHKITATEDKGRWTTDQFLRTASVNLDLLNDVFALMRGNNVATNPKKEKAKIYHLTPGSTISPEPQVDNRKNTPAQSESEIGDVEAEDDPDFNDDGCESSSDDDDLPVTRSGKKRRP